MSDEYDVLESRDPEARGAAQMAALAQQGAHAKAKAQGFARILDGIDPAAVTSRAALAALPVTRKSDFAKLQADDPPFGGLVALSPGDLTRLYLSPGPIADPEGHGRDWWRFARALFAAGFRKGDILHNRSEEHTSELQSLMSNSY